MNPAPPVMKIRCVIILVAFDPAARRLYVLKRRACDGGRHQARLLAVLPGTANPMLPAAENSWRLVKAQH